MTSLKKKYEKKNTDNSIPRTPYDNSIEVQFDNIVKPDSKGDELKELSWGLFGGYKLLQYIKRFFFNRPIPQKELNLEDTVNNLLMNAPPEIPQKTLYTCKELLQHQRTLEDTRARRRLEKWVTKIISRYLITVFFILLINGFSIYIPALINGITNSELANFISKIKPLSDNVIIVILSTTTINIIGLGLIVLKGHFLSRKDMDNNN